MSLTAALHAWSRLAWNGLDRAVFPRFCLLCQGAAHEPGLCEACRVQILRARQPACRRCAMGRGSGGEEPYRGGRATPCSECHKLRFGFDAALAIGPFTSQLRQLCLALKQARHAWFASTLFDVFLGIHRNWITEWLNDTGDADAPACVVAVPLHWRRRLERGYNQADALAKSCARRLDLDLARPLKRAFHTPHLGMLSSTQRRAWMRHAFRVVNARRAEIEGRDVLLVDDVLTSGATGSAAARRLKDAGARRVLMVVMARAEAPQ